MTKRQLYLERCRVAGYEGDMGALVRLIVERGNLVTRKACEDAFYLGKKQRERSSGTAHP